MFKIIWNYLKVMFDPSKQGQAEIVMHYLSVLLLLAITIALIIIAIYLIKIYNKIKKGK